MYFFLKWRLYVTLLGSGKMLLLEQEVLLVYFPTLRGATAGSVARLGGFHSATLPHFEVMGSFFGFFFYKFRAVGSTFLQGGPLEITRTPLKANNRGRDLPPPLPPPPSLASEPSLDGGK